MSHQAADVTGVKDPSERLGVSIAWIDDARDVVHLDVPISSPLLDGEMLDINVSRARRGSVLIDHGDGGLVVYVERSRTILSKSQLSQDGAKVLGNFCSTDGSYKFALGRTGGNSGLELGLEGNSTTGKAKTIASNRSTGLEVSGMSRIDEANKTAEIECGEGRKRSIHSWFFQRNMWQRVNRRLSPVDNTPILRPP